MDARCKALGELMIDLHCHILPGLDDGALDLDDSVTMARQAERDGIGAICATPHLRHDHDVEVAEIASRCESLQRELTKRGIDVRVLPGAELAQTEADRLSDQDLGLATLGAAGGWVLLEPAPGPLSGELEELARRLAQRGVGSVIAHPERHAAEDFEERLRALVSMGCLIQWTAAFVAAGDTGGELVLRLAMDGLVHLLGSDAHSSHGGRPVQLADGYERLASVCSGERMEWMIERAPRAIVRGKPLTPLP